LSLKIHEQLVPKVGLEAQAEMSGSFLDSRSLVHRVHTTASAYEVQQS
jgi:hypothetical protein